MISTRMMELITEGSKEDREKCLVKKGDCLYRYVTEWGEERECILINERLIESDESWLRQQKDAQIDLELAFKYQNVLEERFYDCLLEMEKWSERVGQLCKIIGEKEFPEYQYKEEDCEELRRAKSYLCVQEYQDYREKIIKDIIWECKKRGDDISFMENQSVYFFHRNNMLYNIRKGKDDVHAKKYLQKVNKGVKHVIKDYEEKYKVEVTQIKNVSDNQKAYIKREAKKIAAEFIFLPRAWDVETWIELIFSKFYKEIQNKKPKLDFDKETGELKESSLEQRGQWIKDESKKWFIEKNYRWCLTKEAVMELVELEEEEKRLDLMNYTIMPDSSVYSEINLIINHSDLSQKVLQMECGIYERGISKRIRLQNVKDMTPYLACLLWKESNISFKRLFQITPVSITNQDKRIMDAYQKITYNPQNIFGNILKALEDDSRNSDFWYMPKIGVKASLVCIELSGPDKIKITVEFSSAMVEPFVIELPYSSAMKKISELDDEKAAKMAELAECKTKDNLLRYCAEMVARKYCKELFGISYQRFQEIKCHVNVTITIQPLLLHRQDGTIQVGFAGYLRRNQMLRPCGNYDGYMDYLINLEWENEAELEKDWEKIKKQIFLLLKEKWMSINESKKYYSEYAMGMTDFFEVVYKEPRAIKGEEYDKFMEAMHTEGVIYR